MFLFFGKGKCPFCGNFGKKVGDGWHCYRCSVQFDKFGLIDVDEFPYYVNLWNA